MIVVPPNAGRMMGRAIGTHIVVRDDAGTDRTIATFDHEEIPDLTSPVTAGSLARLRSAASGRRGGRQQIAIVLTVLTAMTLVPGVIFGTVYLGRMTRQPPWSLGMLMILAVGASVAAMTFILPRIVARGSAGNADLLADALLRMRRCAACGYPIVGEIEPSGAPHTCSECGATWNAGRIGAVEVPNAPRSTRTAFLASLAFSAACRSRARDEAGRLFGEPPHLQHVNMSKLPGDDMMRRTLWLPIAMVVAGIVVAMFAILAGAIYLRIRIPPWAFIAILSSTFAVLPLAIIVGVRRQVLRGRRILLRIRRCVACRQRLRREGPLLRCAACDATWRRPSR